MLILIFLIWSLVEIIEALKNELLLLVPPKEQKKYLVLKEVCDEYNFKEGTLYGLTSRREIEHFKNGKTLRFLRSDVEEFIESGRQKTKSQIQKESEATLSNKKHI